MSYPLPTPMSAAPARPRGQLAAVLSLLAALLYLGGYYLPLVTFSGISSKMSEGGNSLVWLWVVPAVLAAVCGVVGLSGKEVASSLATGLVMGMAGLTAFEMIMVHRLSSATSGDSFGLAMTKGIGFWSFVAAAVVSVVAAFALAAGTRSDEPRVDQGLAVLAGVAFLGVPLAILLPDHGSSVFDISDGLVKFGFIVWAVLSPAFALMMAMTRRRSGLAFALGAGVAHAGLSAALLQNLGNSGGSLTGSLSQPHSAIYHWTVWASVSLCALALLRVKAAAPVLPVAYTAGSNMSGYSPAAYPAQPAAYPAQPVAHPPAQQQVAQPQGQWAPDPYGRHQYRLWDGQHWTANVADNGAVSNDPV